MSEVGRGWGREERERERDPAKQNKTIWQTNTRMSQELESIGVLSEVAVQHKQL